MKKILSIKYSTAAFNFSILLLRIFSGLMMLAIHGYDKIKNFSTLQYRFYNFFQLGSRISLILAIAAETLCAFCVVIGLFTRLAAIPLIITMLVAVFGFNAGKPVINSEVALLYLTAFIVLLCCGPGKVSADGMMNN